MLKSVRVLCVALCTVVIYFHCSVVHFKIIAQFIILLKDLEVVCNFWLLQAMWLQSLYQYINPGACKHIHRIYTIPDYWIMLTWFSKLILLVYTTSSSVWSLLFNIFTVLNTIRFVVFFQPDSCIVVSPHCYLYIFLVTNEIEHLFICYEHLFIHYWPLKISSFLKCLFQAYSFLIFFCLFCVVS